MLGVTVVELFGLMGLMGIKLSAIPVVTLVITAGISVEFTVYITVVSLSLLTCGSCSLRYGCYEQRREHSSTISLIYKLIAFTRS